MWPLKFFWGVSTNAKRVNLLLHGITQCVVDHAMTLDRRLAIEAANDEQVEMSAPGFCAFVSGMLVVTSSTSMSSGASASVSRSRIMVTRSG